MFLKMKIHENIKIRTEIHYHSSTGPGVSFEDRKFQMAVSLKLSTFDPILVKPKCVSLLTVFLEIAIKQWKDVRFFLEN